MKAVTSFSTLAASLILTSIATSVADAAILGTFVAAPPSRASVDGPGDPDNTIVSYAYVGTAGTVTRLIVPAGASLTEVATATFASEARIRVTSGANFVGTLQPFTTTSYVTSITSATAYSLTLATPISVTSGTPFSFEFFENAQDGTAGLSEQNWTSLSIQFDDGIVAPPASTPIGVPGTQSASRAANQVQWYSVVIPTAGTYGFDTFGSTLSQNSFGDLNDTQLGLFSSTGALITSNDDFSGTTFLSKFETDLAPGTYYLAASAFSTTFGGGFSATSAGTQTGTIVVNVTIPEPATLVTLAGFAVLALRRRRN